MGDISDLIPDEDADVCVLEEPEHLNWWVSEKDKNMRNMHARYILIFTLWYF